MAINKRIVFNVTAHGNVEGRADYNKLRDLLEANQYNVIGKI